MSVNSAQFVGCLLEELQEVVACRGISQAGSDFEEGYNAALHRVLTLIEQRADVLGMDEEKQAALEVLKELGFN